MTISARYSGTCPECGDRWNVGDLIRADEDHQWKHAFCPDLLDPPTIRANETLCAGCWLVHAQGACDR